MLLVIDNFDSFTFNLVQYFGQLGVEQRVFRNNEITFRRDPARPRKRASRST
jgi:anthranilate/para-aminobenzoate synthase component II